MVFQENLKRIREESGYKTAKEFADTIPELNYATYSTYENTVPGKGREPKYEVLCRIAEKLGTSPNELLGYSLDEYERCKRLIGLPVVEEDATVYVDELARFPSRDSFIRAVNRAEKNAKGAYDKSLDIALSCEFYRQELSRVMPICKAIGNDSTAKELPEIIDAALKKIDIKSTSKE